MMDENEAIKRLVEIHHGHADGYRDAAAKGNNSDADYQLGMCHGLQTALAQLGCYDERAICRAYLHSAMRV